MPGVSQASSGRAPHAVDGREGEGALLGHEGLADQALLAHPLQRLLRCRGPPRLPAGPQPRDQLVLQQDLLEQS